MSIETPAPGNGGGRSLWLALAVMALGGLAALVAIVVLARRDAGRARPSGDDIVATALSAESSREEGSLSIEDATLVLERHKDQLMQLPGVIGIYVGADHQSKLVLRVLLLHGHESTRAQIPAVLDGVPVEVEASDPIKPL
ncbi:MAG TPA: hypothetical protein VF720_14785 [Candidatus Eisenbacteria bacterium]